MTRNTKTQTSGADGRNRTDDLCFTKALLYQLSYIGTRSLRFMICLVILAAFGIQQTEAMIIQVDTQGNIPSQISQGIVITVNSPTGEKAIIDWSEDATTVYVSILPLHRDLTATVSAPSAIQLINPHYAWVGDSFQTSSHTISFWKKKPKVQGTKKNPYLPDPTLVPDSNGRYKQMIDDLTLSSSQKVATVTASSNMNAYPNESLDLVSKVYEISNPQNLPLILNIGYTDSSNRGKKLYYFQPDSLQWLPLPTSVDGRTKRATSYTSQDQLTVAVFADQAVTQGLASWYDQSRYRSFKYKGGNFAASRTLPKGTKVKVTRVKTGKSIVVTINDWGPEEYTGRVLDLEKQAYAQLASTGSGEMTITLEVING